MGEEAIDFVITPLSPKGEVEESSKPPISNATPIAKPSSTLSSEQEQSVLPIVRPLAPKEFLFRRPWLGLNNLGNTCYANSVLTCLFPFPELWDFPAHRPLHQALKVILMSMNVQPRQPSKATPLRPMTFLSALSSHISKEQRTPFRCNTQHDASEILGYVLIELLLAGVDKAVLCSSFTTLYLCPKCRTSKPAFNGTIEEPIINLDVCDSLSIALEKRLSGGTVTVHCNKCNSNQDCTEQSSFLNLPDVLIFRIRRDQFMGGQGAYRSGRQMEYERHLTIGSREGENITPTTYHLVAVSHHVRQSFSSSHFTTTLLDPRKRNLMWKYDDEIVSETKVLDNRTSFILFYRKERRR